MTKNAAPAHSGGGRTKVIRWIYVILFLANGGGLFWLLSSSPLDHERPFIFTSEFSEQLAQLSNETDALLFAREVLDREPQDPEKLRKFAGTINFIERLLLAADVPHTTAVKYLSSQLIELGTRRQCAYCQAVGHFRLATLAARKARPWDPPLKVRSEFAAASRAFHRDSHHLGESNTYEKWAKYEANQGMTTAALGHYRHAMMAYAHLWSSLAENQFSGKTGLLAAANWRAARTLLAKARLEASLKDLPEAFHTAKWGLELLRSASLSGREDDDSDTTERDLNDLVHLSQETQETLDGF